MVGAFENRWDEFVCSEGAVVDTLYFTVRYLFEI